MAFEELFQPETPIDASKNLMQQAQATHAINAFREVVKDPTLEDTVMGNGKDFDVTLAPEKQQAFLELASHAYNPYILKALPYIEKQLSDERTAKFQTLNLMRQLKAQDTILKKQNDAARQKAYLDTSEKIALTAGKPGGYTPEAGQKFMSELKRQFESGDELDFGQAHQLATTKSGWQEVPAEESGQLQPGPGLRQNALGQWERQVPVQMDPDEYMVPQIIKPEIKSQPQMVTKNGKTYWSYVVGYPDGSVRTVEEEAFNSEVNKVGTKPRPTKGGKGVQTANSIVQQYGKTPAKR